MFKDKIGVEVECENVETLHKVCGWTYVAEQMLVGGVEYVLSEPTYYPRVRPLLESLFEKFTDEKFSQRCSTHIHIDISDLDRTQLFNFITLYVMFEEVFLKLIDPIRAGNLFCLPVSDSVEAQNILVRCAQRDRDIGEITDDEAKYCAMNLASIRRHNSLEFRCLQGTKDVDLIMDWIDIHLCLKRYAQLENMTPDKLVIQSSELGFKPLFERVMEDKLEVFAGIRDLEELIKVGMRNAQMFAFLGDWQE